MGVALSANDAPVAATWDGASWTVEPTGPSGSELNGVSCTSPTSCVAVGFTTNSMGALVTLAESWDGANWTVQSSPNPAGAARSVLSRVSCTPSTTSAIVCTAVGYYLTSLPGSLIPLAERWNGSVWKLQAPVAPAGSTDTELRGVSCVSASLCTAVGNSGAGSLAERWNGSGWSLQSIPDSGVLTGVSCTSAHACTAVGASDLNPGGAPVAERWNGTSWSPQSIPDPQGGGQLSSVSCATAAACTAVGTGNSSTKGLTLAERWNGTSWSIQTLPHPTASALYDVSCTSATTCTAVGLQHGNGSVNEGSPLVERDS